MDKLESYRDIIINILKEEAKVKPSNLPDIDIQVITDKENDHYFLYHVGWNELDRIHDCIFHLDIIDDKIWIQENNTDEELSTLFLEKGVPKSDIVLGLQPPYNRKYTEFAIA